MHINEIFKLENFEGSFTHLMRQVESQKLEILEISIHPLSLQLSKKMAIPLEIAAELVYGLSYLTWLKSRTLLPKREQTLCIEEEGAPLVDIERHLLDYSRIKEAAQKLSKRRLQQSAHFVRGVFKQIEQSRPPLQLISLDQLATLVQDIMKKAAPSSPSLKEEPWQVADKIRDIRSLLRKDDQIPFSFLFNSEKTKEEMIVTFLALLELMKLGTVQVAEEPLTKKIIIILRAHE